MNYSKEASAETILTGDTEESLRYANNDHVAVIVVAVPNPQHKYLVTLMPLTIACVHT